MLSIAVLGATPIEEERPDKASGIRECIKLLGRPFILLCFIGIMCHVGIDVGTNTAAPKIIMERLSLPLEEAGFATGLYFIFRTAGCFLGAFLLRVMPSKTFFGISVLMMLAPAEKNEVSGLMIMGLFGGTVFPLAMGYAADAIGQAGSIAVMATGVIYLLYYTLKIK